MQRKSFNFLSTIRKLSMSFLLLGLAGTANATLIDRGPFLVYDDLLNITWTHNARLPGSTNLNWDEATAWAADLVYATHDDWRLPVINFVDPTGGPELGTMYRVNLPNPSGVPLPYIIGNQVALGGQQLYDIDCCGYWSSVEMAGVDALALSFGSGCLDCIRFKGDRISAWAVRSGDSDYVLPEPTTIALFGVGVAGWVLTRRKRAK